jgi:hypothetical protein
MLLSIYLVIWRVSSKDQWSFVILRFSSKDWWCFIFLSRYSFEVYVLCVCTHLVLLFKLKCCALWFLCIVQYATIWGTRKFQPHHNLAFKENKKILVVFLYFALVVIIKRFWSPHMECIIPILLISLKCHSLSSRKSKRGMYIYIDTCTWFTK